MYGYGAQPWQVPGGPGGPAAPRLPDAPLKLNSKKFELKSSLGTTNETYLVYQ